MVDGRQGTNSQPWLEGSGLEGLVDEHTRVRPCPVPLLCPVLPARPQRPDLATHSRRELALVWDFKGSKDRKLKAEQQKQAKLEEELAKLDAQVASKPTMTPPGGS